MPKLVTYRRPAPVSKQSWNHAPDRKTNVPRRAPGQDKPAVPSIALPPLDQLVRKQ